MSLIFAHPFHSFVKNHHHLNNILYRLNISQYIEYVPLFLLSSLSKDYSLRFFENIYKIKSICSCNLNACARSKSGLSCGVSFILNFSEHFYLTILRIHGVNFDIRVQTPGKFASAHPIPQLIIPAKK